MNSLVVNDLIKRAGRFSPKTASIETYCVAIWLPVPVPLYKIVFFGTETHYEELAGAMLRAIWIVFYILKHLLQEVLRYRIVLPLLHHLIDGALKEVSGVLCFIPII